MQIGNPALDSKRDGEGRLNFWWTHGLISYQTAEVIMKYCDQGIHSSVCKKSKTDLNNEVGYNINAFDVIADVCITSSTAQAIKTNMKVYLISYEELI